MPTLGNNPREFIRHNLLTLDPALDYPAPNLLRSDGTVWVKLEDRTNKYGTVIRHRNRQGLARLVPRTNESWWTKPASIFAVVPASALDPDGFPAYVCPYQDNAANFKMLRTDANVMFTGDMNGCTFGVGIPTPNGDVRVGHSNAQNQATGTTFQPNFAPQRLDQQTDLAVGGAAHMFVDPDVYRDGAPLGTEFVAVTVGLRIDEAWEFYYQHQVADGVELREKLATTKLQ